MEYNDLPNLASPLLGAKIVFATDEWFAAADNMLKDESPVWKEDLYTTYGKWMDGWETRRRRTEGHDWCIVQLGIPGIIRAIEVDTAYFTGNFSPKLSIQGHFYESEEPSAIEQLIKTRKQVAFIRGPDEKMGTKASDAEFAAVETLRSNEWATLVSLTALGPGYEETRSTIFPVSSSFGKVSYLRVNMGPDGGIARIRVYGEVSVIADAIPFNEDIDLAAVEVGGLAIAWSNKHYGHPRNLIAPGRGSCMGDGWETARQPKRPPVYEKGPDGLILLPGCDWVILRLGLPGVVSRFEVDTYFYKGNYPESCCIEGCYVPNAIVDDFKDENSAHLEWITLIRRTRLTPNERHIFTADSPVFVQNGPITHVKLTIYPDGGVMRLRVIGRKHSG